MKTAFLAAVLLLAIARPAFAYLDPNVGSMFAQIVAGGVAGVLFVVRLFWSKIRGKKKD